MALEAESCCVVERFKSTVQTERRADLRARIFAIAMAGWAMASTVQAQAGMAELRAAQAKVPPPTATAQYGPDDVRSGELRLPLGRRPFPVAVLIHGGCWRAGVETRSGTAPFAEMLKRRGIAVWNIEYRRVGDVGGGWPGTFEDITRAIDYLSELARVHPLDLSRVTIVGHSAGAHLALWAASRSRLTDAPATLKGSPGRVKPVSVVAIDGPAALAPFIGVDEQVCGRAAIVPLMGGTPSERSDAYRLATPADHLPLGLEQLLVQAELGPFMTPYAEAARVAGDDVRVLTPAGANHFDIITPGVPNGEAVADFIEAEAFRRSLDILGGYSIHLLT